MNQGFGVGLDSAARGTSSRSRRKIVKMGVFSRGQHFYCHPLIIAEGPCLALFGLPTCRKANVIFRDFSVPARRYNCHPLH